MRRPAVTVESRIMAARARVARSLADARLDAQAAAIADQALADCLASEREVLRAKLHERLARTAPCPVAEVSSLGRIAGNLMPLVRSPRQLADRLFRRAG